MLGVKGLCLAWMAGSTIYGTLRTWPKLMFAASDEDAFRLYNVYMLRATVTFVSGIAGRGNRPPVSVRGMLESRF